MEFTWSSFLLRLVAAFAIVFSVYNPTGYCYTQWALESGQSSLLKLFVGVLLLIVLLVFGKATLQSMGKIGIAIAVVFFGLFFGLLVKYGLLAISNTVVKYLILVVVSLVLAVGVSWSYIWRRLTGQVDVEEAK
ncbi:MAG: hypothetical protein HQL66_05565 [Magnetococcales bacterium]|nr:hypothetical protein [Magnetococcales bacterium]